MKFWKNWPYWVRGGFVGLIIKVGVFIFSLILLDLALRRGCDTISTSPISQIQFCNLRLASINHLNYWPSYLNWLGPLALAISIAIYIILGAIIGWTYGKIRSKRQIIS